MQLTRDEIIIRGIKKYGDKITYGKFIYKGYEYPGIFTCEEHGDFEKSVHNFLHSEFGCTDCSGFHRLNRDEILEIVKIKFENRITFEKFIYVNMDTKSIFTCEKHLDFEITPYNLLRSVHGCSLCARKNVGMKKRIKLEQVIIEFNNLHGKDRYDYSEFEYIRNSIKGIIICHRIDHNGVEHGKFLQSYANHMKLQGCPKCSTRLKWDLERLKYEGGLIYGDEIDFSLVTEFKNNEKIPLICNKDKSHPIFYKSVAKLIYRKQGCSACKESLGECYIRRFLEQNNIKYEPYKRFPDCKNTKPLEFDFYVPAYNTCIEFDGQYHYSTDFLKSLNIKPIMWHSIDTYENMLKNDIIKNEYCRENNIHMLRIPFWELNIIPDILYKYLRISRLQ